MTSDIFIARQPIFDRRDRVIGFELLFRSGPENFFAHPDADTASTANIGTGLLGFGLSEITGTRPAYVNLSRRVLLDELYTTLPVSTVLELLETVEPDAEVVNACQRAKGKGYRIALDDFVYRPAYDALLPLADIIKVDFRDTESRSSLSAAKLPRGVTLLAEKVETKAEREAAVTEGFTYFQGYYFCKPEMLQRKDIRTGKLRTLSFLAEVNQPDPEFERIEELIRSEVGLSVKLLRYLNSAGFGWQWEVTTIDQAVRLLGLIQLRKWASLMAVMALAEDRPPQLAATALVRARFSESLASACGFKGRELELFLCGLLSLIDAMVGRPMPELLEELAVSSELRNALVDGTPPFGTLVSLAIAYEAGDWPVVAQGMEALHLAGGTVSAAYADAVRWTDGLMAVS